MTVSINADFERFAQMRFFQQAGIFYPGTKIYVPNAKWVEPKNSIWFALHIIDGDTFNANIGAEKIERTPVVLHISVYTPVETADRTALEMAETAARWFSNQNFRVSGNQYVNFRAGSVKSSKDPKTGKFRVIATVPGNRDASV